MSKQQVAQFERLTKMIEHELELAGQGRTDELHDAVAQTGAYMASLPAPAPPDAQIFVNRAHALRARVVIEVERLRESIELNLSPRRRARQINSTYSQRSGDSSRYSTSA